MLTAGLEAIAPGLSAKGSLVKAQQAFTRRVKAWEFRIEQQKLFREDVRDLVELTLGRMDIYQLVGALLLDFAVTFFCKNKMFEHEEENSHEEHYGHPHAATRVPSYVAGLFVICNVVAVGCLVLAIWLAMHASVISHTLGVRLLTGHVRLAIPDTNQIDSLKVSMMPLIDRIRHIRAEKAGGKEAGKNYKDGESLVAAASQASLAGKSDNLSSGSSKSALANASSQRLSAKAQALDIDAASVISRTQGSCKVTELKKEHGESLVNLGRSAEDWIKQHCTVGADIVKRLENDAAADESKYYAWCVTAKLEIQAAFKTHPCQAPCSNSSGYLSIDELSWSLVDEYEQERNQQEKLNDEQINFKRFLNEQQRWLAYDAYSRLCMCLGINSTLQALSYYIVAIVSERSVQGGLVCLAGVQMLSVMVLKIDVRIRKKPEPGEVVPHFMWGFTSFREFMTFIVLLPLPPFLAMLLVWLPTTTSIREDFHDRQVLAFLALSCYILHGGWLYYFRHRVCLVPTILRQCRNCFTNDAQPDPHDKNYLPQLLRTVQYLEVIHPKTLGELDDMRADVTMKSESELSLSYDELTCIMIRIQRHEQQSKVASTEDRNSSEVKDVVEKMWQQIDATLNRAADARATGTRRAIVVARSAENSARRARSLLRKCWLWQNAPNILAELQALQNSTGTRLTPERRKDVERAYRIVLQVSENLDLGISAAPSTSARSSVTSRDGLAVLRGEQPAVSTDKHGRQGETVLAEPLQTFDSLSATKGIIHMEEFRDEAERLRENEQAPDVPQTPGNSWPRSESHEARGGVVPDVLPKRVTLTFLLWCCFIWWFAAVFHCVSLLQRKEDGEPTTLVSQPLPMLWPRTGAEITGLACSGSLLWVSTRFGIFTSDRGHGQAPLVKVASTPAIGVLCDASACDALHLAETGGRKVWQAFPLKNTSIDGGTGLADGILHLPRSWRATTATRMPCWPSPCSSFLLAAWEGSDIIIAQAHSDGTSNQPWRLRPKFAVRPELSKRSNARANKVFSAKAHGEAYHDVEALHMSSDGQTLFVLLSSGVLDIWDLSEGLLLGRWRVAKSLEGSAAIGICDGDLLLARGSSIETFLLPVRADVLRS
jgi:hypothetical protein